VYNRVPNIQYGGRNPEVQTTLIITDADVVSKPK